MYSVGQIIYSILEDKQILLPLQIVEQVIIKNLEGEETKYTVLVPNKNHQKLSLDKFDKVFDDLDEASSYLLNNAKKAIDDMVMKAIELEDLNFKKKENKLIDNSTCKNEPDNIKIELGDGIKANISPKELEKLNANNLSEESKNIEEDSITWWL